ncbi:IS6 family transposase [Marinivivus vitaminiproducens]|nr:IS6 family transposase [Geminicoccaceae bacterium SCSIO 64248]
METSIAYKRRRFPAELIAHAVWLYVRFPLSLRLVEEMRLERGIVVSYETRRWAAKFGPAITRNLRRRAPRPGDILRLDEVRLVIRGAMHWLWRAVDQHGVVLDEILQRKLNTRAAKRLLVRLLKRQGWTPRRIVTDKLASYDGARREVAPSLEHRRHKGLNNRAENAHVPVRRRERQMQGFRSPGGLQRFASVFPTVRDLFVPSADKRQALSTHLHRLQAFTHWRSAAGMTVAL